MPTHLPGDEETDQEIVAEINITPLTDVFLVLLIIFMVTTSVVANQSKNIDLPGAEVSDTTPQGVDRIPTGSRHRRGRLCEHGPPPR